jgi:hypothetical protein
MVASSLGKISMICVSMITESKESGCDTKSAGKCDCMHHMLGNLIRSFQLQDKPYYDLDDPWGGILVAVAFALRSTYHMTQ